MYDLEVMSGGDAVPVILFGGVGKLWIMMMQLYHGSVEVSSL